MGGFKVYIYGSNTSNVFPAVTTDWFEVPVLGLRYARLPDGEAQKGQLGGYRHPKKTERTIVLDSQPVLFDNWFSFIDNLTGHLTKKYIKFRRGDYPSSISSSIPEDSFIIPTGRSVEHTYSDGTKSIDVECVIYE